MCFGKRPTDELYDLKRDPDCVVNLALSDEAKTQVAMLQDRMFAELRQQEDPRMFGQGKQFDEYLHSTPAHVGFYERYMNGEELNTGWVLPGDFEESPQRTAAVKARIEAEQQKSATQKKSVK